MLLALRMGIWGSVQQFLKKPTDHSCHGNKLIYLFPHPSILPIVHHFGPLILIKDILRDSDKAEGMIKSRKQFLCEAGLTHSACCSPDRAGVEGIWERSVELWETQRVRSCSLPLSEEPGHCRGYCSHANSFQRILRMWIHRIL